MVCCIGSLGKIGIAQRPVATNQQINSIVFDEDKVFPKYGYYACSRLKPVLESLAPATTVAIINKSKFEALEIPLPPLAEQKRIAAILDKADSVRRKRQQAIELADQFLRAVFLDMFGDPVSNPKKWKKGSISTISKIITGYPFKSVEFIQDGNDSVRLCRGANTLTGYFDWSDIVFWPKDKSLELDEYLIKEGDVILAMDRPWISSGLKVCIVESMERETYLVQRVARIRPIKAIYGNFIYSCIKSKSFETHCRPTETTVPHISPIELKNFEIILPDESIVKKYYDIVCRIRRMVNNMKISDFDTELGFNSLNQKAFAGKL
ncbi:restriction endonuclease [Methylovulum psychrotolerans]|uniref:Restriction endonuclease n=2 Tax=Methylovulum psychrotolerans TaxID=1704499 RepID=A0A1Z4C2K8_9GAMM|nr:restriction endonuclease [Methylovulum psychrotolerans]